MVTSRRAGRSSSVGNVSALLKFELEATLGFETVGNGAIRR